MPRPRLLARLVLVTGLGWLAIPAAEAAAANLVANPSFEATGAGWLAPWSFTTTTGAAGAISQVALTDGSHAARVNVTQQSPSSPWRVALKQPRLPLTAGQAYTVTFAAKASAARPIEVQLQGTASPYVSYLRRSFNISTSWATYSATYTASTTLSDVSLRLNLASAVGSVWIDDVALAPPPAPPPSRAKGVSMTPFAEYWGANVNGMRSDFADMSAAGISWARIDLQYTPLPNPAFDAAVAAAKDQGIQLLVVVHKPSPANDLGTDAQRATFRAWLAQMVVRYKYHVRYWEIHNEPNIHYEWTIDDSVASDQTQYMDSVRRYVTHLRDGYETVKANDPAAKVVFGGLSEWRVERFMDALVTTDAYRYFDVMSFHPYGLTPDRAMNRFTSFLSKMRANVNYTGKPIWVTEAGFNTSWTNKAGFVASEQIKADYLVTTARRLYAAGATLPLFAYTLHENSAAPGYGLTSKNPLTLSTQYFPAFFAYRDLVF